MNAKRTNSATRYLVAAVILTAVIAFGQNNFPKPVERAEANLVVALKSDNFGLRQSAVVKLMKLKVAFPELELNTAKATLIEIAKHEENDGIRYKIKAAIELISDPVFTMK